MKSVNPRTVMAAGHDLIAAAIAWSVAFLLRFNFEMPGEYSAMMWKHLTWVVVTQALVFRHFGLYRGIWRYASLQDLRRIVLAVAISAAGVTVVIYMLRIGVPRSVLILDPLLLVVMMVGSRLAYRMRKEGRMVVRLPAEREPVLVLGAGTAGANLVAELALSRTLRVVGLLDDDPHKRGRQIHGVSILGTLNDLAHWRDELLVKRAIIAFPGASHQVRRRAVELCASAQVEALTVPSYDDLVSGKVTVSQIRQIEVDDLLGRDPIVLDLTGMAEWIGGRSIMVTGAGGSIGSEICRQLMRFRPGLLVLLDISEFALYRTEQDLHQAASHTNFVCAIGDAKNRARVSELMSQFRPSIVFHAAAYKHVPLMEHQNAWEAVVNNVVGTRVVAECAIQHRIEKFVLISTDKAVNPTNVMGASKRLAELVCKSLQRQDATSFVIVRFGNVLGSTGSVVPKFKVQIAHGGPVTVTHPEIKRYFMSITEATQLVLQAGLMGQGGELFVLDMGEPVRIDDLARDLIRLSGFTEDEMRIQYTGLRAGEKLNEELFAPDENSVPTPVPKVRIAVARNSVRIPMEVLDAWLRQGKSPSLMELRTELKRWVPEYHPEDIAESPAYDPVSPGATITPLSRRR